MADPDFLRIERDEPDASRQFVVHAREPGFLMEFAPDPAAADPVGDGVMKRVCLPNSWCGHYETHFRLLQAAQEFLRASCGPPAPKELTRRIRI